MSLMKQITNFFAPVAPPPPPGRYSLEFRGHYYTGRAYNGEVLLNPDPNMALLMTFEQAHFKRQSERYFAEFSITPMVRVEWIAAGAHQ